MKLFKYRRLYLEKLKYKFERVFRKRKVRLEKGLGELTLWYYEVKNQDHEKAEKIKKLIKKKEIDKNEICKRFRCKRNSV